MLDKIDWAVLARQAALIIVPVIVSRLALPDTIAQALSGPLVELVSAGLVIGGSLLVGWVVWVGQRREQRDMKILAVAEMPSVSKVEMKSEAVAASIPSSKVVA
jgi:hypothetical protein